MLVRIADFLRMIKFSHSIFALPFAGIAIVVIWPVLHVEASLFWTIGKILICMVLLRSAAMTFNRLVDRTFDAENPRTANREIPAGKILVGVARWILWGLLVSFVLVAFWINTLCGLLSPLAILATLGYSYAKRFTFLCHYALGLAIGLAPSATAIALVEMVPPAILSWSAGLLFYIAGFDILYSLMDQQFDREKRLHSIPARFGTTKALWLARLSHLMALIFFTLAAFFSGALAWPFLLTLLVVTALFVTEHLLVREDSLSRIPLAFFHINASISTILFCGLLLDFWVQGKL